MSSPEAHALPLFQMERYSTVYISLQESLKEGRVGRGDVKHKNATKYPFKEHFPLKDWLQICNETFQYTAWGQYVSGLALCKAHFMRGPQGLLKYGCVPSFCLSQTLPPSYLIQIHYVKKKSLPINSCLDASTYVQAGLLSLCFTKLSGSLPFVQIPRVYEHYWKIQNMSTKKIKLLNIVESLTNMCYSLNL